MALTARATILWMCIITVALCGCDNPPETASQQQTTSLRKKIATPQRPSASKAPADRQGKRIIAQKPRKKEPTGTSDKTREMPQPSPLEKRGVFEPSKSDSLKLAEGFTQKPAFFYDPAGKHDPFESPFEAETERVGMAPTKKKIRKKRLPLTPLQRIELSQLKLVAIVVAPKGNKALVEDPSGKGYIVTPGTYIGQNFGRVKQILKNKVIVEGEVEDFFSGKPKIEITELRLPQKVGDG